MYLNKNEIKKALVEKQLHIRPLLDPNQVTNISVDLRLGCDFLASIKGSRHFIDTRKSQPNLKSTEILVT